MLKGVLVVVVAAVLEGVVLMVVVLKNGWIDGSSCRRIGVYGTCGRQYE